FLWIRAPSNDIDLFVIELAHDVFDPRAAHANTRAYGVHFFVRAPDCDFGAITRFPRDAANFHRAIGDFAHFKLKKPAYEIRMTARDDDLGTASAVLDRDHIGAETVAHVVIFHDDSLSLRHDGFKFSKIEDNIGTVEAPHCSTHDFAGTI